MIYALIAMLFFGGEISTHLQRKEFTRPKAENAHMDNCYLVKETNKYKCEEKNG